MLSCRSDSTARHADFAGLVQLLPPGLVWQPALDEPDDATSSAYRAISAFFGGSVWESISKAGSGKPALHPSMAVAVQEVPIVAALRHHSAVRRK